MESIWQDLKFGVRTLAARPGLTVMSIIALALGIAATTVVFSSVSALVLHPLPFAELDRLVSVWETSPRQGTSVRTRVSPGHFSYWKEHVQTLQGPAAWHEWRANLTGSGRPQGLRGVKVTSGFFPLLGMDPLIGRTFEQREEEPGRDGVAVLSHAFWRGSLGADPRAVGRTLVLNGRETEIVGVMPAEFDFPLGTDLWVPLALSAAEWSDREDRPLRVLARLAADTSLDQARGEIGTLAAELVRIHPQDEGRGGTLIPLLEEINFGTRQFTLFLMGGAGFLLLLAAANVGALQLVRAGARGKEFAVRMAIGAGRVRLIRQLLTENVLLALPGGALGCLLGAWGIDLMKASVPAWIVRYVVSGLKNIRLDGEVLAFTLGVTVLAGILAGLAPALSLSRAGLGETLRRGAVPPIRSRGGARGLLVVFEVALALVLVVGAGLMVRGFRHILEADRGFDARNVLTLDLVLPDWKYPEAHQVRDFHSRLLEQLRGLPDAAAVAVTSQLQAVGGREPREFLIEGRKPRPDEKWRADVQVISDGYFAAMRIPLREGRGFNPADGPEAAPVALISEGLARRYWPGESAVGRRVQLDPGTDGRWIRIVGVAGDVDRDWIASEKSSMLYLAAAQYPRRSMRVVLRTEGDPLALVPAIRDRAGRVDGDQPVENIRTLERILAEMSSGVRMSAVMMSVFSVAAFLLAAGGLFTVVAGAVSQRRQEVGIRMALGGDSAAIHRLFVWQGLRLALVGAGIGLAAALALTQWLSSVLFGVLAIRPLAIAALAAALLAVAALASYIPARRASRVNPVDVLRLS